MEDLKKLIDEHADRDPDLSVAPDENSILDVALDLEQSLAEQAFVQGNAKQPKGPSFLDSDDEETLPERSRLVAAVEEAKKASMGIEAKAGKRRIIDDDDDDEERSPKKRKRAVLSDEEEEDEEETPSGVAPASSSGVRDGGGEEEAAKEGEGEPGREKLLMDNIFGETSSEESIIEDEHRPMKKKKAKGTPRRKKQQGGSNDADENQTGEPKGKKNKGKKKKAEVSSGSETESKPAKPLSDFEAMMQKKKQDRSRSRRKTGIDLDAINAREQTVQRFILEMSEAIDDDRRSNREGKPTVQTVKLLPEVLRLLNNSGLHKIFIEQSGLEVLTDWLAPLPNKCLPYLKIRDGLLRVLEQMPTIEAERLKESCLGKAVMLLYRHPQETRANKRIAERIIQDWARPIFNLETDPRDLSREVREKLDYARQSQIRRRQSTGSETVRRKSIESAMKADQDGSAKPGDPSWCPRARVPMPSLRDYVIRPQSIIDEDMPRMAKRGEDRKEKILKQFKEAQKKRHSTGGAYKVNLVGGLK